MVVTSPRPALPQHRARVCTPLPLVLVSFPVGGSMEDGSIWVEASDLRGCCPWPQTQKGSGPWSSLVEIQTLDSKLGCPRVLLVAGVGRWPRGVRSAMTNAGRRCWTKRHRLPLFLMKLSVELPGHGKQTGQKITHLNRRMFKQIMSQRLGWDVGLVVSWTAPEEFCGEATCR